MGSADPDTRPGFRRRILVVAGEGAVTAMLEDDIHCLSVTLRHDGVRVIAVEPSFDRPPWTTCPGAVGKLIETFTGKLLTEVTAKVEKTQNCTHLHDMAVLAAAHAGVPGEALYDVIATDPADGVRRLELRLNGELLHAWTERDGVLVTPAAVAGKTLQTLHDWLATLEGTELEGARILRWAARVALGRTLPMEQQNDASKMKLSCYTFQPERVGQARLIGDRRDFSDGTIQPLAGLKARLLAERGN